MGALPFVRIARLHLFLGFTIFTWELHRNPFILKEYEVPTNVTNVFIELFIMELHST